MDQICRKRSRPNLVKSVCLGPISQGNFVKICSHTFVCCAIFTKFPRDLVSNTNFLRKFKNSVNGYSLSTPRDGLEPPTQWLTATCSTD
jgi:hypothetical protein